ncbi:MAG: DUF2384 domain-containing protein [Gemmatimonadetes bacterium]|nr:DUF2384 domain-containing protein [Gemmatimonadota bacterium]
MSIKQRIANLRKTREPRPGALAKGDGTNASAPESAAVSFNVKDGTATFHFSSSTAPPADLEVSSEWLIFVSDYVRVRRAFPSDVQMAESLGLDRSRLIAWKKGSSTPRLEHVRYLADVATTVDALERVFHPAVIADWLTAPKFEFADQSPLEMLRGGHLAEVLQSVNAAEHGAYI